MNGEQWSNLLSKDSLSEKEWLNATYSAGDWCSCAVGVLILGDEAVKDPGQVLFYESYEKRKRVTKNLTRETQKLGHAFAHAMRHRNIKKARKIWDEIHGDKK